MSKKSLEDRLAAIFEHVTNGDDEVQIHLVGGTYDLYINPTDAILVDGVPDLETDNFEEVIEHLESEYQINH